VHGLVLPACRTYIPSQQAAVEPDPREYPTPGYESPYGFGRSLTRPGGGRGREQGL